MKIESFLKIIGCDFYTGVPDSQLKALCDYLMDAFGIDPARHIIAANEGNCVALAAGYYLATGKVPLVYMQNSGEGNIINPTASLLNDRVYAIPMVFVIGWRGEPGVPDEPQHIYQGEVTLRLLEDMNISFFIVDKNTTEIELEGIMREFRSALQNGKCVAFVVRKGALSYEGKIAYRNDYVMTREEIIRRVVNISGADPIVSTTGKASRELFEIRAASAQGHQRDFLTVGSMGHASSVAMGVALNQPKRKIWCLDGDGALLMHMGSMALIGAHRPPNLVHVLVNNAAHETVGGMPTVAGQLDLVAVAAACGYPHAATADCYEALDEALKEAKQRRELSFVEAKCAIGARANLGRPTSAPLENKRAFMRYLQSG